MTDREHPPTVAGRFDGDPLELKHLLETESRARPGKWATRLVGRETVAMRVSTTHQRWELCIGREPAPTTLYETSRWEGRVRDLQRSLKCLHWQRGENVHRGETIIAVFSLPLPARGAK